MSTGNFEPEESRFFPHGIPCGIDEAGRGPYAGPLSLALVAFSPEILESILAGECLPGLNDSKKLSESKRERLYSQIRAIASICCHTFVSHSFIDRNGINRAVLEGIQKCYRMALRAPIAKVGGSLTLLIDGNYNFSKYPESKLISSKSHYYTKGDSRIVSISAASIIAKVTRDRWMTGIAVKFPGYGFESHKGYGSAKHEESIRTLGLCKIHRRSFTKKFQ